MLFQPQGLCSTDPPTLASHELLIAKEASQEEREDSPPAGEAGGPGYSRSMDLTCPYCERTVDVLGLGEGGVELIDALDIAPGAGVEVEPPH